MPTPALPPELSSLIETVHEGVRIGFRTRTSHLEARVKGDGSLVTAVDLALQEELARGLAAAWPGIPVLGEESTPEEALALAGTAPASGAYWCLDPLDGTSNFVAGFPTYAASVALVDDQGPRLGVVHDLARNETFAAARGLGAWLDHRRLGAGPAAEAPDRLDQAMALVDLKRLPPHLAARVATEHPFRSQRNIGSSALEWCWVAAGRCHLYLHGAQRAWDYAAGMLILAEAGGSFVLEPGLPHPGRLGLAPQAVTAASSPALLAAWRAWIAESEGELPGPRSGAAS